MSEVKNAEQAVEIAFKLLSRGGGMILATPLKAEKFLDKWIVELSVSFRVIRFEIDAKTGEVLKFGPLPE